MKRFKDYYPIQENKIASHNFIPSNYESTDIWTYRDGVEVTRVTGVVPEGEGFTFAPQEKYGKVEITNKMNFSFDYTTKKLY